MPKPIKYLLIAAAVAIFAVYAITAGGQNMYAPGQLDQVHAQRVSQCSACHVPFQGAPDKVCLNCHKRVSREIASGRGTHGAQKGASGPCINCHRLHVDGGQPTQFDLGNFNHEATSFGLARHQRVKCQSCHGKRFGRPVQNVTCLNCHTRLTSRRGRSFADHAASLGTNCLNCHDGRTTAKFKHTKNPAFFVGKHLSAACRDCHKNNNFKPISTACQDCHQQKHASYGSDCQKCHQISDWKANNFKHKTPLTGRHANLSCGQCHKSQNLADVKSDCISCHQSPHKSTQFNNCQRCHSTNGWPQLTFDHSSSNCVSCHQPPANHYGDNCTSCHTTANWNSTFSHPQVGRHDANSFPCQDCHPNGYNSYTCTKCHQSGGPRGD